MQRKTLSECSYLSFRSGLDDFGFHVYRELETSVLQAINK